MYTQEDASVKKWVFRACDNTNRQLTYLYWVELYEGGYANRPFVLSHAQKTHF